MCGVGEKGWKLRLRRALTSPQLKDLTVVTDQRSRN